LVSKESFEAKESNKEKENELFKGEAMVLRHYLSLIFTIYD